MPRHRTNMNSSGWVKGFFKTAAATVLYGVVHSLFASHRAKRVASAVLGVRRRNALYRLFYLLQSAATMVILVCYIRRQPRKLIVNARGLSSVPFRLCQLAGVSWAIGAAYEVGFAEILGVRPLVSLLRGADAILPEPEAQGPTFDGREMRVRGPFRLSRHPLNLAPLPILWFNPRLSTSLLAYNLVSTAYLVLGSKNEEYRLQARYGQAYQKYKQGKVPFYLPEWR